MISGNPDVSTLFAIPLASIRHITALKNQTLIFRIITIIILGVPFFRNFVVLRIFTVNLNSMVRRISLQKINWRIFSLIFNELDDIIKSASTFFARQTFMMIKKHIYYEIVMVISVRLKVTKIESSIT